MGKTYRTPVHAAQAFVRAGRRTGAVEVLGGGWWRVQGWPRAIQGGEALARELARRGKLRTLPDGRGELVTVSPGPAYAATVTTTTTGEV